MDIRFPLLLTVVGAAAEKMMQEWADTEARLGSDLKGMMAERDGLHVEMSKGAEELAGLRAELDAALGKVDELNDEGANLAIRQCVVGCQPTDTRPSVGASGRWS